MFLRIVYTKFMVKEKHKLPTSTIDLFHEYCKGIDEWPESWEIDEKDIKIVHDLVALFKPFIISLIEKGLSKKTVKSYRNYLRALGGELIREVNDDKSNRRLSAKELVLKCVNDTGGPLWFHAYSEADHAKYDSVCKRFLEFLTKSSN